MSYTSIHMLLSIVVYRYNHGDGEKDIIFLLYNHNIRSHMVMPINSNIQTYRTMNQAYIVVVICFKGLGLLILILFMSFIEYNGEPDYINSNKRLLSVTI